MKVRNVRFVCIILLVFVLFSSVANAQGGGDVDHNCRFWAAIGADIPGTVIQNHLANLPNSIENLSPANPDGWSVGYYPDGNDVPVVNRGFPRAILDPNFNTAVDTAAGATPRIAVSHIRNTSSGITPASGNPHPFDRVKNGKHWLMGHNGTIDKNIFYDPVHPNDGLIRQDYFAANPPQYGSNSSEWIDTDLYQIFVLQTLEDFNWQVKPALGYVIQRLREEIPSNERLNFFLTDGTTVWAYREGNGTYTLYYLYDSVNGYSAVASQYPSASQGSWVEMNNGELITMQQSGSPLVEDIEDYFGGDLLVDNDFDASANDEDLRTNGTGQDWYESRADAAPGPTLLTLNHTSVGGNDSKKAGFSASTANPGGNVYLSQEFGAPQSGTFAVQWDIYVDEITNLSGTTPDRTGWMLIGDAGNTTTPGPNSNDSERFVYMGFLKDGGGDTGTMDLVARDRDDGWTSFTTIATGLNLDQWYTIKVICDLDTGQYQIYVDGEYKATVSSRNAKTSVTHISFAQWNDGAGAFYVDNVGKTHTLTMAADPANCGTINPAVGQHVYPQNTTVSIEATAYAGCQFNNWTGGASGSTPTTVIMNTDKTVTANFSPGSTGFLVDNDFNASANDEDLRINSGGQDWYESREDNPTLLTLHTANIGGNTTPKVKIAGSSPENAYVSQEFGTPQSGTFAVEWDIYVESILDISDPNPDRTGWMLIGDDTDTSRLGPNSNPSERFVQMAFFKNGGGTSGAMDLVARERGAAFDAFTTVASGLEMGQWYTIKVICNLTADTYDIYVDDVYQGTFTSYAVKTSVTHISFAQWNDGAGAFYVDNVKQINIPPVAQNDSDDTDEDTTVIIAVLDNDSDADGALVESSVIVVDAPDHGAAVANANGTITYTPNSNYHGSDSFTYTVDDNNGATSNEATVTVTVDSVNDTPTDISLSSNTVAEGMPVGTNVGSFSTTDPDTGDTHTYSLVSGTGDDNNTLFTIDGNALKTNQVFDFEVENSYSIRVRTNDGHGGTFEKQFTITVTNANEPPVFQSIPVEEATVGEVYSYLVTATDDDGDDCSFSLGSGAPNWLILIDNGNDTAMLSGTPPSGSEGEHSVIIQVSDGIADPVEQVISIFVKLGAPEDTKLFLPIIIK